MLIDRSNIDFKQNSHQLLRQPDSFILDTHLDTVFPGLSGKNQKFCRTVSDAEVFFFAHGIFSQILLLIPFKRAWF
jgi:hypothetical protein